MAQCMSPYPYPYHPAFAAPQPMTPGGAWGHFPDAVPAPPASPVHPAVAAQWAQGQGQAQGQADHQKRCDSNQFYFIMGQGAQGGAGATPGSPAPYVQVPPSPGPAVPQHQAYAPYPANGQYPPIAAPPQNPGVVPAAALGAVAGAAAATGWHTPAPVEQAKNTVIGCWLPIALSLVLAALLLAVMLKIFHQPKKAEPAPAPARQVLVTTNGQAQAQPQPQLQLQQAAPARAVQYAAQPTPTPVMPFVAKPAPGAAAALQSPLNASVLSQAYGSIVNQAATAAWQNPAAAYKLVS